MKRLLKRLDRCLILIVCLSLILNLWGIWNIKFVNSYYMAATVSMVQNFHNFFFASFDPAGFVSIDKPPLAFWIQSAFALQFGVHGWSVILPQALAGTGSVLLIYFLVKPSFGAFSARIAALLMAVTPIAVAVSRTNNVDSLLVLVLLIGTLFLFKSVDQKKWKNVWLMLAFAFIGIGFNIKMLEAYLILPAFVFFYLIASKELFRKKLLNLFFAVCLMMAISLSWAFTVDSFSKQARPYVGSSTSNSVTELAFGYNGTQRLMGQSTGLSGEREAESAQKSNFLAGLTRLFRVGYGTQISWFLPFALLSIPAIFFILRKKAPKSWYKERMGRESLFWVACFMPALIVFSFAGFFHRYYFIMLAPSIAVLCGIGWPAMLQRFNSRAGLRPYIFPLALMSTLTLQSVYVGYYNVPLGFLLALTGFILFNYIFFKNEKKIHYHSKPSNHFFGKMAVLALLISAPLYWSLTPMIFGGNNTLPEAGPQLANPNRAGEVPQASANGQLIRYLSTHQSEGTFLFGTIDAPTAAPYIIKTGKPVMAIGGFNGTDPILKPEQLEDFVKEGKIHYFYFPSNIPAANSSVAKWIREHGKLIDSSQWAGVSAHEVKGTGNRNSTHTVPGKLYELNTLYLSER